MKIQTIAIGAMAMMATAVPMDAARPVINQLGIDNTLVRITDPGKYLIMPVQESMPDARIDILVDGKHEQTIYVRLADSNVDYTVPLDLTPYTSKGTTVLNIVSEVDRTHSRQASDFVCWERMEIADEFDTTNREKFRPAYHHTPQYGWMNDPNGMFYKDGVWHLYYQYNPYGSKWQNMTWGHSSSTDLTHWQSHPLAIEPNGMGSVFSGNSVVDVNNTAGLGDSTVVALYTSAARSQIQSMAYSRDNGETFTFYPGNPVIANSTEARDPNMFWHEPTGRWILILAHALDKEMQIYSSTNLKDWTLESSFGKGYGSQDGVWECPDLMEFEVDGTGERKWVLVCNINPGGPMGGSATQYFVGDFDGHKFTCDTPTEVSKWMDWGKDHYATVSWSNAPDNRHTVLGWMSNWQYANEVPTRQFRSANTLPRDLGLFRADDGELYLSVKPSPELDSLRGDKTSYGKRTLNAKPYTVAIPELCEIVLDYNATTCGQMLIELTNASGDTVVMAINTADRTFTLDRANSGLTDFSAHFPATTTAPLLRAKAKGTLRIYIDRCSIEVFDSEGRFAMTNLIFPEKPYDKLSLSSTGGKANVNSLDIYSIK